MISDHAYIYSILYVLYMCVKKSEDKKEGEENSTVAVVSKNM